MKPRLYKRGFLQKSGVFSLKSTRNPHFWTDGHKNLRIKRTRSYLSSKKKLDEKYFFIMEKMYFENFEKLFF